ncbi:uncharacterized protein LOC142544299 [Primulina tabacum]|uniref:uncharacterized protein LOC142544299 n=1 Tax=Primulina tabacum TaxID=48773 RepID=UPI003F59435D
MAPYEALYGRKCRSPLFWEKVDERKMLVPELVQQTADVVALIQVRMRTAQSRQKSYADVRRRPLAFEYESLDILPNLSYEEMPVQILDRKVKVLRNKEIGLVKVLWRNQVIEEATWEPEEEMKHRYPSLFDGDSAAALPWRAGQRRSAAGPKRLGIARQSRSAAGPEALALQAP